jgi:hypothetical protein
MNIMKIVSGGQTGVDRAALDAAIEMGIPYAGWCPKGGWAEDLPHAPGLLALYDGLRETPHFSPRQRTKWNIRDADRLMVLVDSAGVQVSQGTEAARDLADRLDRPHIVLDLDASDTLARAFAWLGEGEAGASLCIAGPRESEAPGIYAKARPFLCAVLARVT